MKTIDLSNKYIALVDDEDYQSISELIKKLCDQEYVRWNS